LVEPPSKHLLQCSQELLNDREVLSSFPLMPACSVTALTFSEIYLYAQSSVAVSSQPAHKSIFLLRYQLLYPRS